MHKTWLTVAILLNAYYSEAYKILVIFPLPSKSHSILGDGVVRHLLEAGHEVTYITPNPTTNPPPKLHQIDASSIAKKLSDNGLTVKALMNKQIDLTDPTTFLKLLNDLKNSTFTNENVVKLLNDKNQKFDLFLAEWFFSELNSGFAAVFECPYIWLSTMEPHWQITRLIDEPLNPSYNPDILSSSVPPFCFYERVKELVNLVQMTAVKHFYLNKMEQESYEEIFGPPMALRGKVLPSYNELIYNVSLILGNSHVSLGEATRLPQNYKPVGGYHIDDKLKPLPEKLSKLLNGSKHGVIYFSMGSNLKSKDMPEELKSGLLKMFGELKYNVIWKFEETLPNVPKNVHIIQWAPQLSILAHPNCILFITHGGILSTTETIHYGKPMIGIPAFGDQFINVKRMVNKGFALKVDLSFSLPQELKVAITEILDDPKYSNKAKELSRIYHDRAVSPGAELVHWVEHVVRTGGAPHLRSPALHVPCYQKYYLDLLALIIVVLYATKKILSHLIKMTFKSGKLDKKKNQ